MNFASVPFLFYFLPIFAALYFLWGNRIYKNVVILCASLLFYAWGEGFYLGILIGSIVVNHAIAGQIVNNNQPRRWLLFGIITNLLILIFFKYSGFIMSQFGGSNEPSVSVHLPLGISFFTFQAMSMLVDIYRGQKPMGSVLGTGIYISMFPQLVAGPIVRFNQIRDQILERQETFEKSSDGIRVFILGLAQKVLIADVLAGPVDLAFSTAPGGLTFAAAWIGIICFSFQIYYDFAGYSNMAIGLGRMLGFELPKNFNYPYSARSFRSFWRRWHMTLSAWFRDYLYIPLGGSKGGSLKTYRNLLIVFILCGFWHGAAWTFLLWGLWHGAFLIFERLVPDNIGKVLFGRMLGPIYVYLGVTFGWVLFRADTLRDAVLYWKTLIGLNGAGTVNLAQIGFLPVAQLTLIAAGLLAWEGWEARLVQQYATKRVSVNVFKWAVLGVLLLLCMINIAGATHQPFIYFRF